MPNKLKSCYGLLDLIGVSIDMNPKFLPLPIFAVLFLCYSLQMASADCGAKHGKITAQDTNSLIAESKKPAKQTKSKN